MKTSKYDAIIEAAARRNGIPLDIFKKLINTESSGNSSAVSPKGAKGLGQLMDATGMEVFKNKGYKGTYDPFNPEQNVNIASDYYKQLLDKYNGNTTLAAAAYNAGPGAVDKYGGIPPYAETKEHVKDVAPENPLKTIVKNKIQDKVIDSVFSSAPSSSTATPIGSMMDGSTMMSDGSVLPMSPTGLEPTTSLFEAPGLGGQILGGAAALKGGYDSVNAWQHGGSGRAGLTQLGAGLGTMVGGPLGSAVGAVGGNLLGYGMQGDGWKNNATLVALGPIGWTALAAKKFGLIHQTTKQAQQERWSGLANDNKDPNLQAAYLANHPEGDDGIWKDGKYAGQKWSFEKANDLAKTGNDFNLAFGSVQAGGDDWLTLTPDVQQKITNKAAQEGLYYSKKGDILVNDKERFKQIKDEVIGGNMTPEDTKFQKPILSVMNQPTTQTAEPAPTFEDKLTKIKKDLSMIQNIGGTNANDYAVQYAQNLQQSGVTDKSETAQVVYSAGGALKANKKLLSKSTSIFNQ
jgi:hypothetical protein